MPHTLLDGERYTGQMGLLRRLGLEMPSPATISIVGAGTRRSIHESHRIVERYPAAQDYGDSAQGDLKFALRNEALDLRVVHAALRASDPADLAAWIRGEPNGIFSRRAWFLYERLTGERLDVPDAGAVAYVPALDPERHIVRPAETSDRSRRHRVLDNLLGTPDLCPVVRRTPRLDALMAVDVAGEARALLEGCDPAVLRRAVGYLYTKETRSSFEIEGETVDETRAERFVRALQAVEDFDLGRKESYVELQNVIVGDPRFHARDWRTDQSFVGSVAGGYRQQIHFVGPKPEDVSRLMKGLGALGSRLHGRVDPIVAAALVSFAFVFIHPFDDGNGRIHRYLVHRVLADAGVTPPGVLFPVSAAMLRDMQAYDAALESFSRPVMPHIRWAWVGGREWGEIVVRNDTLDLYRFFDGTALAEYLYARVIETVRQDLREELEFVAVYDRALRAVRERLDGMPDRKVSLFVVLCLQNGGHLARSKRKHFPFDDDELAALEALVAAAMAGDDTGRD